MILDRQVLFLFRPKNTSSLVLHGFRLCQMLMRLEPKFYVKLWIWMHRQPAGRKVGWTDGRTDERSDRRSDVRTDGRSDGRTDGRTVIIRSLFNKYLVIILSPNQYWVSSRSLFGHYSVTIRSPTQYWVIIRSLFGHYSFIQSLLNHYSIIIHSLCGHQVNILSLFGHYSGDRIVTEHLPNIDLMTE